MAQQQQIRFVNKDGSFNLAVGAAATATPWQDPYHWLMVASWPRFALLVFVAYLAVNASFAGLYMAVPGSVGPGAEGFWDHFNFSVHTLATIGYGVLSPQNAWGNALVAMEALTGLLGFAVATGLVFARFARPTARVVFSDVALINRAQGSPHLMFRVANERANQVVEATLKVLVLRTEKLGDGTTFRRFIDLPLQRSTNPAFVLSWTALHKIDESSPLWGLEQGKVPENELEILVLFSGVDGTFNQPIYARQSYLPDEVKLNGRFRDLFIRDEKGARVSWDAFHIWDPIPPEDPAHL